MMEAQAFTEETSFVASKAQYTKIEGLLGSAGVCGMAHSELEMLLHCEGMELMRRLFQDHLELRAQTERDVREESPLKGSNGVERRYRRSTTTRGLMTIFGPVQVQRAAYFVAGESSLFPMDAELNLPADSFSHGVRERMAREAANQSFEKARGTVMSMSGASLGKRQAEELTEAAARDFGGYYAEREQAAQQARSSSGSLLIISTDGKGVTMRPEGLREKTRKAAERQTSVPERTGEQKTRKKKPHAKRMATVATVYTLEPHPRTPKEVAQSLRGVVAVENKKNRPKPENKQVWASLIQSQSEVVDGSE